MFADEKAVLELIERLGLSSYRELFEKEKITTDVLAEMGHGELKEIGILAFGHRHKLIKAAERLALAAADGAVDPTSIMPFQRYSSLTVPVW